MSRTSRPKPTGAAQAPARRTAQRSSTRRRRGSVRCQGGASFLGGDGGEPWDGVRVRASSAAASSSPPARLPAGDSDLRVFLHHPGPARHLRQLAVSRRPQHPVSLQSCPLRGPWPTLAAHHRVGAELGPRCLLEMAAGASFAHQCGIPGAQPSLAQQCPRWGRLHMPSAGSLAASPLTSTMLLLGAEGSPHPHSAGRS